MGNLFFVFTPLQLFVAQQIIRQEKLENNIIIWGWYDRFSNVFELMRIDNLWQKQYFFENLGGWFGASIRSVKDILTSYHNYQWIKAILEENRINSIFLGEILNQSYRFTSVLFHKKGYKIVYFEEGTSHYINRPYFKNMSIKARIKQFFLDTFYFIPLYGIKFAKWHCNPNRPYKDLPIDCRYSIIPFHHEPFDVILEIKPMFSKRLKEYVCSSIDMKHEHRVMLMTDPLRELIPPNYLYLYFDIIKDCIDTIDNNHFLYIKFHPREIQSSRDRIIDIAEQSGVMYRVLSDDINICVEYYLQLFSFDKIYFFNAATYFYNGYAFPQMEFVKLMPILYQKCISVGLKNLTYMENMLCLINKDNW